MRRILPILLAIILTVIIFTGCSLFNTPDEEGWYDDVDTVRLNIGDKHYFKINIWARLDSFDIRLGGYKPNCLVDYKNIRILYYIWV